MSGAGEFENLNSLLDVIVTVLPFVSRDVAIVRQPMPRPNAVWVMLRNQLLNASLHRSSAIPKC